MVEQVERFGDRLYKLRNEHGLQAIDFVTEMNKRYPDAKLDKSKYSRWEANIHLPRSFTLMDEIAEFYGVTTDYLMCKVDGKYETVEKKPEFKRVPIISKMNSESYIFAQENIEGYDYLSNADDIDFCFRISDDSMLGTRILKNDKVYIHQEPEIEDGKVAVVLIDEKEILLRRVYKNVDAMILHAENPSFKDLVFAKKEMRRISIVGKAIRISSEVK